MYRIPLLLLPIFLVAEAAPGNTGPAGTQNSGTQKGGPKTPGPKKEDPKLGLPLGDLFTNGTIGHFEDEKSGRDRIPRLYINTNRTSDALSEKLVQMFKHLRGYAHFDDFWLNVWLFPHDGPNELALQAIRAAFRGIFSRSKAFYDELNGVTAEQIGLQYPFEDSEVGGNACYMSRLDELCSSLGWRNNASVVVDYTMHSLLRIIGPGCESKIMDDSYLHSLQLNTYDIARTSNFTGGVSNRCFHKFFVRYHNYSSEEYIGTFVKNLGFYLKYERIIYGFCTRLLQARGNVVPPSSPTIKAQITAIRDRLLEAQCILTEKKSPCSTEETSTIASWLLPNETSNRASAFSDASPYGARKNATSSPPTPTETTDTALSTSPITHESNETRPWSEIASNAAKQAIGDKTYKYPAPESALETYRALGMLVIALLKQSDALRDPFEYKVLVFYPANEDTEFCIRNGTRGDLYSSMHKNVRFLVARYDRVKLDNVTWESETSLAPKIQQVLSEIDTQNQCARLKKIDEKLNGALSEFGAVAAIKCARKFVWYELGYRYFQAAWTNSVDIPSPHKSDYSSKCGKIVVFRLHAFNGTR